MSRVVWELIATTFNEFWEDKAQRLGAALAYYAAFSLAPTLVIVVYVANMVYLDNSLTHLHARIAAVVGVNAADAIIATIHALQSTGGGGMATALSVLALFIGATAAFGSLQDAMNTIWEVTPKPRHFLIDILRTRFFSFLMVLCFCLSLILSLAASTAMAIAEKHFETEYPGTTMLFKMANQLLAFTLTTIVFAALYKVLPDVRLAWSDVSIGAVCTATLFTLGRIPLEMYLRSSTLSSAYGAAGSVMVLLAWVYYSSQILFLGAEFTQVYANRFGSHIRPARGAVFISEAARIKQGIPHAATLREAHREESRKWSA